MRGNTLHDKEQETSLQDTAEELSGSMDSQPDEQRLMRSVLESDEDTIDDGTLVAEATNQGVGNFTPDLLFQNLVQNYSEAKRLYGETLIRSLTDYSSDYIKKNVSIPEFKETIRQRIEERIEGMREKGLVDREGYVTEKGLQLSALVTYAEEIDHLESIGMGHQEKRKDEEGDKEDVVEFQRGKHRFRDVAMKQTIKMAVRRGHSVLHPADIRAYERAQPGKIEIILGLDSSGSMRGEKIRMSKKAGIALAYRALHDGNDCGLITFTSTIERALPPTENFMELLHELVKTRASKETDLAKMVFKSTELFSKRECTKHLIILTDAVPTKGENPRKESLHAASVARDHGITVSIIGIGLDEEGERLAREMTEIGNGRLYCVSSVSSLDMIMLQEYDTVNH